MTRTRARLAAVLAFPLLAAPGAVQARAASDDPPTTYAAARTDDSDAGTSGRWDVAPRGPGEWAVWWTAPSTLRVGATLPEVVSRVGRTSSTVVDDDGRTVRATVRGPRAPRPRDLDVVRSGDRLDEPGYDPARPVGGHDLRRSGVRPGLDTLPVDPAAAGPYAVTTSDYELPGLKVRGLRRPVEVVGHVVEPAATAPTGPRPLVLFLHGRHETCYDPDSPAGGRGWPCVAPLREVPSHLGYDYLQRRLASQGFATVSVRANGVNAQDGLLADGGAGARSALVQRHLRHWAGLAEQGSGADSVDLSRVVLVGHSRGGEGVDLAATQIPLDAPYRVVGQVLLAPTDVAAHAAPYVPTVTVLPSCDGDVADLQGQRFVDTTRDLLEGDTALRSAVLVGGANHNFFNTEWTPGSTAPSYDEWNGPARQPCGRRHPDRLSAAEQRDVALGVVAAATRLFTGVDDSGLPLLDGSGVTTASYGDADVRSHALGGGRETRSPGEGATATAAAGTRARACTGLVRAAPGGPPACGRGLDEVVTPHWRSGEDPVPVRDFVEVTYGEAGGAGGLRLAAPLDLTGARLDVRVLADPARTPSALAVRLTDGSGATTDLQPAPGEGLAPLPEAAGVPKAWAQALVVRPSGQDAAAVDLSDVRGIELVSAGAGRVWVADVSAVPDTLAEVPVRRGPRVDVGVVPRTPEGDPAPGRAEDAAAVEVPLTLTEPSPVPVVLDVSTRTVGGEFTGPPRLSRVVLPAGATTGVVRVPYTRDRRHGFPRERVVTVYPVRGAATGSSAAMVVVTDDDPEPRFRVVVPRRTIVEGDRAVLRLVVSGARTYSVYAGPEIVRTPRDARADGELDGHDVRRAWLREHVTGGDPAEPLWRGGASFRSTLGPRRTVIEVVVPTRADGVREGVETITLSVLAGHRRERRTIRVRDAAGDR